VEYKARAGVETQWAYPEDTGNFFRVLMDGLSTALSRLLLLLPDARQITISTSDGAELMTESRGSPTTEDAHTISSLAPSFSTSAEQSARLDLGSAQYAIVWAANSIILQTKIENLVVSILLSEHANLGLVEEHIPSLVSLVSTFCSFVDTPK
jgi:Mitogen-activated protein kinase kinase 1 interacting